MSTGDGSLGSIEIGAREIFDEVRATRSAVELLTDRQGELVRRVDDHENRVRALERSRWPLPSIAALVGVAALIIAAIPLMR